MRPKRLDIDLATSDPDGLADNNSSASTTLTLDGSGLTSGGTFTSADGLARQLSITETATQGQADSTFTVVGTDADGRPQTEDITGPTSTATVTSTKTYLTVTSVTIAGGDSGDTVDMGTSTGGVASTQTIPLDFYANSPAIVQVVVTGTINFDIEVTYENPLKRTTGDSPENAAPFTFTDQSDLAWVNDANFTGKSASLVSALGTEGIRAMRVYVNSFTTGAELQVFITQPR